MNRETGKNTGALEQQSAALVQRLIGGGGEILDHRDVAALRAKMSAFLRAVGPKALPVEASQSRRIAAGDREVAVTLYWPPEAQRDSGNPAGESPPPILLYFHGGGFTHFSAATHDTVARYLCNKGHCIVVNVDYRLAPEHKFPAPLEDAYAALCWVSRHADEIGGDASRIVVAGESAGGTISVALCLMTRSRGGPAIALQIPMCASLTLHEIQRYSSWRMLAGGEYLLTPGTIEDMRALYLSRPEEELNPLVSPILAPDLTGLPPALVITAQFDPLVDEAAHYSQRLREAQVPVTYECFAGTIHAFMIMAGAIDLGYTALDLVAEHILAI
jgi:acetyl esterase